MSTTSAPTTNPYLQGNYGPVAEEVTAHDLAVSGRLPAELDGLLLRNGPNPYGPVEANHHWFLGDGMLHGIRLRDGRAEWYRNRWVRTEVLAEHSPMAAAGAVAGRTTMAGKAAVNVIRHARRTLALGEVGLPWLIGDDLETLGEHDFGGAVDSNVTAHPKIDPVTGETVFFGYGFEDQMHYHVADASGSIVHSTAIAVRPSMMHDVGVTATRTVLMDLPVLFSFDALTAGRAMPFAWDAGAGARLGVLPRRGTDADVTWIDLDPCYVFHVVNAHDEGPRIVMDVVRYPKMFDTDLLGPAEPQLGSLVRWVIDPDAGRIESSVMDDRPSEFPRVDPRVETLPHRLSYRVGLRSGGFDGEVVVQRDHTTGAERIHAFGPGRVPGEAVVVPAAGAPEGSGWVLTVVYDAATDRSDVVVLSEADVDGDPVATVHLPVRVPFGFHGNWIPTAP